jgi:hypothetical protein
MLCDGVDIGCGVNRYPTGLEARGVICDGVDIGCGVIR